MAKSAYERLMDAQGALRLWYKEHPGIEPPAETIDTLDRAHDEYRADVERRAAEKARERWEQGL